MLAWLDSGLDLGVHAEDVPIYFEYLADLLAEAMATDVVTTGNWKILTNRRIYLEHAKSFPVVKAEIDAGVSLRVVWRRLGSPVLSGVTRDVLYLLIHNKLPVKERLFRIGLNVDPYCPVCPGGIFCDVAHYFCACSGVAHVWGWVRGKLIDILGGDSAHCSDWELVNLLFPGSASENEAVWLVGSYIAWVWREVYIHGKTRLRADQFFGFLRFKYKSDQLGARLPLVMPDLFGGNG